MVTIRVNHIKLIKISRDDENKGKEEEKTDQKEK